jgi:hypothetical protein
VEGEEEDVGIGGGRESIGVPMNPDGSGLVG